MSIFKIYTNVKFSIYSWSFKPSFEIEKLKKTWIFWKMMNSNRHFLQKRIKIHQFYLKFLPENIKM